MDFGKNTSLIGKFRRLSKDYEYLPETSESMIHTEMVNIMVRRLAKVL
jgi:putative transposase